MTDFLLRFLDWLSTRRATGLLWALALLPRLALLLVALPRPLKSDALNYFLMAKAFLSSAPFEPYWPPGLPLFLAPFLAIPGADQAIARGVMLLPYVAFAGLMFHILWEVAGRRAANLGLLLFAIYPNFILHSIVPLTQLPMALLLLAALWGGYRVLRSASLGNELLWGFVLGLLPLFRASTLMIVLILPLLVFLRTRRPRALLLPVLIAGAMLGLWLVRAHDMAGRFVPVNTANVRNLYLGNNEWTPVYRTWWFGSHKTEESGVPSEFLAELDALEAMPGAARDRAYRQKALEHIQKRPDLFLVRSLNRGRTYLAFDTFTGSYLRRHEGLTSSVLLVGIMGLDALLYLIIMSFAWLALLARRFHDERDRLLEGAGILFVVYGLPYWFSFSHPTYHFPVMPLAALGAVIHLDALWGATRLGSRASIWKLGIESPSRRALAYAGLALLLLIQVEWVAINTLAR